MQYRDLYAVLLAIFGQSILALVTSSYEASCTVTKSDVLLSASWLMLVPISFRENTP